MPLYDILGVPPDSTSNAIRAAFRTKALEHHPDQKEGTPESDMLFRPIHNAYQILSEPARKVECDRFMRGGAVFGRADSRRPDTMAIR